MTKGQMGGLKGFQLISYKMDDFPDSRVWVSKNHAVANEARPPSSRPRSTLYFLVRYHSISAHDSAHVPIILYFIGYHLEHSIFLIAVTKEMEPLYE